MHNSKNSAYRKDIFTSTLLAQAKLLGISADFNNLYDLNNKIDAEASPILTYAANLYTTPSTFCQSLDHDLLRCAALICKTL